MEVGPRIDSENYPANAEKMNNVNPELVQRLIGFTALEEYLVPLDPMDDLQCESCQ